jgi:hypothetical protein
MLFSDNCNSVEIVQEICANLSNDVFENSSIQVFPNPFNDMIKIVQNSQNESVNIDLYDVSGKKILSQDFSNNEIENNGLEFLSKGIYFLKIQYVNGRFVTIKMLK